MSVPCPKCGEPLDSSSLSGLCARCMAMDFLGASPEEADTEAIAGGVRMGDYEIFEELARGGMGVVYHARQRSLDREVAVKMILSGVLAGDEAIARFKVEAAASAGLRHPHIVAIHEIGEENGMHFFSMEYVAGKSLSALLRDGPLPARRAAELVQKIADAVAYAHGRGVVHRDLKPSNVLVDAAGEPRVTDFGLAKKMGGASDLTLSGQILGTPGYLAPEQARGQSRKAGPAVDIYGIGAILYHLLAGRPPFVGEDPLAVLRQVESGDPPSLRLLNPGIPLELEAVTLKCLAREPERRYTQAAEIAEEMRRWLDGRPVLAKPVGHPEKFARWVRRNPVIAGAACAVFFALTAVAVVSTIAARRLEKSRASEARERGRAEASAEGLRVSLYAADMPQVQRALSEGDFYEARLLLDAHRPAAGQRDLRGWEWRRFWQEARGDELASRDSGREGVTGVVFSSDGSHLAMGSGEATVWDTATLSRQAVSPGLGLTSVAFSPDGETLYLGEVRARVLRWRWRENAEPVELFRTTAEFVRVAASPAGDVLAVGCGTRQSGVPDGAMALHDAATGALRRTLPEAGGFAEFSPDGALLATGSWGDAVKLWDVRTGEMRRVFNGLPRATSLRFSADGSRLVVSLNAGECRIVEVATGAMRSGTPGYASGVWDAALSPDGAQLATVSLDQSVRLWDAATGRETAKFFGHVRGIGQVAWAADGQRLATGGADGTVKFWPASAAARAPERLAGAAPRRCFSPDGHRLLVRAPDGTTALHAWPSLERLGAAAIGEPLGFLPGTETVLSYGEFEGSKAIRHWNGPDFQPGKTIVLPDSESEPHRMKLSEDGRWLAGLTAAGRVRVWDLAEGGRLVDMGSRLKDPAIEAVVLPDPPLLAVGCAVFPHLRFFSLPDGAAQGFMPLAGGPPSFLLPVDGGRVLLTSGANSMIRKLDVTARSELWQFAERNSAIALSPDGQTLACAASYGDETVRLWHLPTRRAVARFHTGRRIASLAFAPDGSALLLTETGAGKPATTLILRAPDFQKTDDPAANSLTK